MSDWKLDDAGNYKLFQGVTIIAPLVDAATDPRWQAIHDLINSEAGEYFKPLPPSSFHMTLCDVTHVKNHASLEALLSFLMRNFTMLNALKTHAAGFEVPVRPGHAAVYVDRCIGLIVFPEDSARALKFRADSYAITGEQFSPRYTHHMTLAYNYRPIPTGALQSSITASLESKIREIMATGPPLQFHSAKLCYFDDMTAFHPL